MSNIKSFYTWAVEILILHVAVWNFGNYYESFGYLRFNISKIYYFITFKDSMLFKY